MKLVVLTDLISESNVFEISGSRNKSSFFVLYMN